MAQTYTRQSTLTDGDTITASLFNNEYNQIVNAFAYSSTDVAVTGHRHDGSSAQGGNIPIIGDLNFFNKIVVDGTNNRWGIFVEVAGGPIEQVRIQDGAIVPVTTNDIDLGTAALQFKDIFIDGTANIDSLVLSSGSTVTAILDEDNLVSDSATALATQQSIKAYVDAQVTAQDLDIVGDTGTDSIDLDSETLTFTGGTGITSVVTAGTVTHNIDSTVTTLTGTQTLTNKTLTAPVISGDLTTDGNIDGRDVATDGTKLDGIEALADVTDTANVTAAGALMDSELTNITAVKALNQGVATTDSPSFAGLTATTADINAGTIDGTVIGGTTAAAGSFTTGAFSGEIAANGGIALGDGDVATFGAGDDLQIYHDGSVNVNRLDSVSSSFAIKAPQFVVQDAGGTKNMIWVPQGGSGYEVKLSHDGNTKLATTATGIDVTGTATMDGLEIGDNQWIYAGNGADLKIGHDGTDNIIRAQGSPLYIDANGTTFRGYSPYTKHMDIASNGDISFYEDTGTTPKFFWDASAEDLQIGSNLLNLSGVSSGTTGARLNANGGGMLRLASGGVDALYVVDGGNVGIGGTQASSKLFVDNGAGTRLYIGLSNNIYADAYEHIWRSPSAASERMRIDASGNLLVGTSVASGAKMQVSNGGAENIEFYPGLSTNANRTVHYNRTTALYCAHDVFAANHDFYIQGDLKATLDANGNLLVGTTDTTPYDNSANSTADNGIVAGAGLFAAARYQGSVGLFNRTGNDGEILGFKRSGAAVGSIFSGHGGSQIGIGTNTTGITFNPSTRSMMPADPSSTTPQLDATLDIGFPSVRWKDLYLSGGVYLGGTGAANHLDDYEEGTWSPAASSDAHPAAYNFSIGYYTKIGRKVHVTGQFQIASMGNFAGAVVNISGLPFNIANITTYDPRGIVGIKNAATAKADIFLRGIANTNYMRLEANNGNTSSDRNCNADAFDTGTICYVDLTYFVA